VTPSILPDNTIRLQIDGTVAAQVGTLVPTGSTLIPSNSYRIVNEAHLANLSRVPSGYSLILGGFVTVSNSVSNNKVPILGSIPLLGQAFRFKSTSRSRTNLAFIITPVAFQAENPQRSVEVSEYDRGQIIGPRQDLSDSDSRNRTKTRSTGINCRNLKNKTVAFSLTRPSTIVPSPRRRLQNRTTNKTGVYISPRSSMCGLFCCGNAYQLHEPSHNLQQDSCRNDLPRTRGN
jgi:hypothetical protein